MSTIYAFTTPARGHLYPLVPVLAEFASRGHRVKIWTLSSELAAVRALGLEAVSIDPAIEGLPINDWEASSESEATDNFFLTLLERAPYEIAEVNRAIDAERPDLLITDINAWGAPAAAEASGVPWASFSPFFCWLPARGVPVFGPGLKPMPGPAGRLRDAAMWKLVHTILNRKYLDGLNEARAGAGAGPLGSISEIWTRPPRLLYMTVPELDYPRAEWPASFRFVGPQGWEPPAEAPAWLEELDQPLVLVTASTEYQRDDALISTALAALADQDVSVIATSAGNDPAQFSVPANARIERYAPHGPILERAEAVICHGGMGITQKALAAGVPVCTVGWGRDQLESGRRVEVAGAGALLPRKKLSPERLRGTLAAARSRRHGAERIATAIAASGGPSGAADELEAELSPRGGR